jgi:predicted N-acetyltransferase YhbS
LPRSYRRARPEEHRALVVQDAQAFGDSTASGSIDRMLARTPVEELRVLERDGVTVGLLLARFHRMFWGGRAVPASQLSGLSIGAEHRGRGAAGELLRAYLEETHDRGAGVGTLFPATVPLYRRAGYEYAGTWTLYEVAARHLPHAWPAGYRARPGPVDDPAPLQERFARLAPDATAKSSATRTGGGSGCSPTTATDRRRCSCSTGRTAPAAGPS